MEILSDCDLSYCHSFIQWASFFIYFAIINNFKFIKCMSAAALPFLLYCTNKRKVSYDIYIRFSDFLMPNCQNKLPVDFYLSFLCYIFFFLLKRLKMFYKIRTEIVDCQWFNSHIYFSEIISFSFMFPFSIFMTFWFHKKNRILYVAEIDDLDLCQVFFWYKIIKRTREIVCDEANV